MSSRSKINFHDHSPSSTPPPPPPKKKWGETPKIRKTRKFGKPGNLKTQGVRSGAHRSTEQFE